ncbi:phage tail protein [Acinetobacter chengduensis]|uniref:Tip attachment protein J domain-containing protein n=1 Tax=Acinetobacter chengduensis TaxID=2420890 RepID=A0ABX9TRS1_9GAMM|nr:phage tail protein [Acinetobacter chengduensis]RLL18017.1 hypothetical protein D9K81_16330 [Acinetobacter chengduensis]
MAKKKKQTIGYRYRASAHAVLCHGPVDSVTKISFQDKDAYLNEESENKTITVDKPALFGGDEQAGGVQGKIELHFGGSDQPKSSKLQEICSSISDAFNGLISAYRGVVSVVFDKFYYGTSPQFPESTWRVKRIHTRHDGQVQWYDEKAEILPTYFEKSVISNYKYLVIDGISSLSQLFDYASIEYDDSHWSSALGPYGAMRGHAWPSANTGVEPKIGRAIVVREEIFINDPAFTGDILINVKHDDGGVLYFNGQKVNFTSGDEQGSYATITTSMMQVGRNVLFVGAVDGVPSGSDIGIYLGVSYSTLSQTAIEADINPAHIIRECLTNPVWGIGVAEADIDDVSFRKSADTLYTEKMGMSIKWDDSTSIEEFIEIIKTHINAELYFDKSDAKWKLYLIRADYNVDDLDHLNESHVQNLEFERRTLAECINSVTLTYWDRERSKDSTVTVQDIARIAQQGGVVSQSVEYRGFTNSELASRIAYRELQTLSANLASVSFDVTESQVQNWHLGKPFKLSDISYGLSGAIFRVKEMRFGDGINNTVSIDAVEDSFSSPMQSIVEYVPPIKTSYDAKDATAIAFEVPYIELVEQYGQDEIDVKLEKNPDLSYVGMAAIRPNNSHINAALFSDAGAGYDEVSSLDFCPAAELKNAISYTDSALHLQNVREFNLISASNRLQIGNELMSVVSYDAAAKTLTVKRGVSDTVPAQHIAGRILYVWDNRSGLDSTEYLSGESVLLKALTQTSADQLSIAEATAHTVTCAARAIRPYPPANVKINNEYWPAEIETDLIVNWDDRNRLQQTGGEPLSWFDASVAIEPNTQTHLILTQLDENNLELATTNANVTGTTSYTMPISLMQADARFVEIILKTVRDGYECLNPFVHTVELSQFFSAPYDLTVEFKND